MHNNYNNKDSSHMMARTTTGILVTTKVPTTLAQCNTASIIM